MGDSGSVVSSVPLLDEIKCATAPSRDLCARIALLFLSKRAPNDASRIIRSIDDGAYLEAATTLLEAVLTGAGYMAGKLPDGTAHVRVMLQDHQKGYLPIDVFRPDGCLALAMLESVVAAGDCRSLFS